MYNVHGSMYYVVASCMSHWPTLQIFHHIKLTLYNETNVILQFHKLIYAIIIVLQE